MALIEDNAFNDITSDLTIDEFSICAFQINARQDLVFCGKKIVEEVFLQLKNPKNLQIAKSNIIFWLMMVKS